MGSLTTPSSASPPEAGVFRVFVSSAGDLVERQRAKNVVSRLNGEFVGLARLDPILFEEKHYQAHDTFQPQIASPVDCHLVVAILKWRIGTRMPDSFARMPNGEPYPSGTAYEILSAVEKRKAGAPLPDVYVFRFDSLGPSPAADDPRRDEVFAQWAALKAFIARWFFTKDEGFKAAFNSYKSEDDFETQLETLLRKWLADKVANGRVVQWPAAKGSPFRGLSVFGAKHAPVFFGRSADIRRATESWCEAATRGTPFLLVVGASGAGKSSLARAGLVPRLTTPGVVNRVDSWRVASFRPGDSPDGPFASLAAALLLSEAELEKEEEGRGPALPEIAEGNSKMPGELAALLKHADSGATRPLLNALDRIAARTKVESRYDREVVCNLVLIIDQLDELFGPSIVADVRDAFAALLTHFAATKRVWIVATLRADLYQEFLGVEGLRRLKIAGATYDLAPPGSAELAEIVRAPAAAAGLVFDVDRSTGDLLDERLLREADRPDMLPLVQLALSRLWDARKTDDNHESALLPFAAYDQLGGLRGIIDEAGERAIRELSESARARLPHLVRSLAELAPNAVSTVVVRSVPLAEAAPDAASKSLVDALVAQRLLTRVGEGGAGAVRFTHQRVLSDWTRAAHIVADSAEFYRVRNEIEAQRDRWRAAKAAHKPADAFLLPSGLPLAEARNMASKYRLELSTDTLAFVEASRRRANRAQMIAWSAVIVFALVAIGAGVAAKVAFDARAAAEQERTLADKNYETARDTVVQISADLAKIFENNKIDLDSALALLVTLQRTIDRLGDSGRSDPATARSRVAILYNFARAYALTGHWGEARAIADQSVSLARELLRQDTGDYRRELDLAHALGVLGFVDAIDNGTFLAVDELRESWDRLVKITVAHPEDNEALAVLLVTLESLATAYEKVGDDADARTVREKANAIHKSHRN